MSGKKTLEEYQIQDIAKTVFTEMSTDFVRRGEFDIYTTKNDAEIKDLGKRATTLENKDEERDKDKRAVRVQMIGLGLGVALNVIIWVIAASSGFKVGV